MSDIREAPSSEDGNSGFEANWQRLARPDTGAPVEERHEDGLEAQEPGQDSNVPPSEAAPEPAPAQDDIWADAPEPLRIAYEEMRIAREKAENAVRTSNGRVSQAAREAATLRAALARTPAAPPKPEATAEEFAQQRAKLVGEYDEVNAPLADEVLDLKQQLARLTAASASREEQDAVRHQIELAQYLADEEAKLVEAHDDWAEVVMKPEFVQWVQSGPQFIRDGIARNGNGIVDHLEAAKIIDLFKSETGMVPADDPMAAKRLRQLEAGRIVPARIPGVTPSGTPDDFQSEWKRLAARGRQQASRT